MRLEVLPGRTADVFDALARMRELSGLTLVGGTALALQIGHRISQDLDFATFESQLPGRDIDQAMLRLQSQGFDARLVTDPELLSRHRINTGENLLDVARDYVVDGVKLTFFTLGRNKAQRAFYTGAEKWNPPGCGFGILGLEGMKVAKTLVLEDRVKSRDLFDLRVLVKKHGYSVKQALDWIERIGTRKDVDYIKSVLRGDVPLSVNDEGLLPVGVRVSMKALYRELGAAVDAYEVEYVAERLKDADSRGSDSIR